MAIKTKKQFIDELGIIEARRQGYADKVDQLVYAAKELSLELGSHGGLAQWDEKQEYSLETALGFLRKTLREFK